MINKFKDFLKKFSRRRDDDFSDQEEFSDEMDDEALQDEFLPEDNTSETVLYNSPTFKDKISSFLPFLKKKTPDHSDVDEDGPLEVMGDEEVTGETTLPASTSSWKDKLSDSLSSFRQKNTSADIEAPLQPLPGEDDITGETPLNPYRPTLRERIRRTFSGLRDKMPINVKEWKLPKRMSNRDKDSVFSLSPSLSQSTEKFLSRQARETIHQFSLAVLIFTSTYTIGKVTALFMKGPPAVDTPRSSLVAIDPRDDFNPGLLNQVKSINIFRTERGLGQKKSTTIAKCDEAQSRSNLPIKLMNTVVLQDDVKSLASVQVRGGRDLQEVRIGDQISNLAKIFKIERLNIIIRNLESGVCEYIASDKLRETRSPISVMTPSQSRAFVASKKMPGIENIGNKFNISKNLLDEKIKDIASILTQARAIKIQNPDGTLSFKLTEVDPEGIFPYLGLQDQDTITSINGKPIYDINEVMSLFAKIKNLDKLQLGIKRDGTETNLDYNIQK